MVRRFGLLHATALNMTNMIGIGPFITIPLLMSALGGPQAMLGSLLLLAVAACGPSPSKPPAQQVVCAMMQAMGGQKAWDGARYWRYDWVVERNGQEVARVRHLWDRDTGRYRVEWKNKEGKNVQALFDVGTKRGRVWVDGAPASAADSSSMLERAYGRFINDGYWLMMPWKLQDPHVHVEMAGDSTLDGQAYDLVHVTFDSVGLTPKDQYWAFVNRKTHLMDRWAYFLEGTAGQPSLDKATPWKWSDWQNIHGMMMARDRVQVGGEEPRRIHFPVLAFPRQVDARVFESPDMPMPDESTG